MDAKRFVEILKDGGTPTDLLSEPGCNALKGLNLIAKYLPLKGVESASHDMISACGVDELCEAGITEDDARKLRRLNWMTEYGEYLACFV